MQKRKNIKKTTNYISLAIQIFTTYEYQKSKAILIFVSLHQGKEKTQNLKPFISSYNRKNYDL